MTKDESPLSLPTPVLVNPKGGASIPFASPTPTQTTVDFKVDYSHINQVAPGKNTINDVKKTQGNPISSSVSGDKIYFYYQTPLRGDSNKILFKNNIVVYALENVYSDYRGTYESMIQLFGQPDFTLYSSNLFSGHWYAFLAHGLLVQSSSNEITIIVYFAPQDKASFMQNIAGDLGLSEQAPAEQSEFTGL